MNSNDRTTKLWRLIFYVGEFGFYLDEDDDYLTEMGTGYFRTVILTVIGDGLWNL